MADAAAVASSDAPAARQAFLVGVGMLIIYVLWGSVYVAVRVVVEHAPPLMSIGLRYAFAGLILALVTLLRRGPSGFRLTRQTALGCAFLAIMLPVLTNGVVTLAVSMGVGAGPAALMTALVPISVILIRVVAGERPRALTWLGILIGFAGLGVLLLGGHSEGGFPFWPSVLVVLSANCWALGSFLQPKLDLPSDSFVTAAYELVFGGLILTVWGLLAGEQMSLDYPAKTWIVLAYLTASSTIAFTTYVWLLDNARISLVSTHAYVNPVVAVFLAWLLLSEPITWPILVGGATVVVAVVLVITEERGTRVRATPPPDALAE